MCIKYVKCKGNKLLVKQRTLLSKILDTKYLDCLICLERSNSISKIKNFMIVNNMIYCENNSENVFEGPEID